MRRFRLSARLPRYEMGLDLAKGIRLFDSEASILIREGQNVNGDWVFIAKFNLDSSRMRYEDLHTMFRNSVEAVGGALLE